MPGEDVGYTCLSRVLTAPWVLKISPAIKLHMFSPGMICESRRVILTTQQLAEETPLPLVLCPPDRHRERAPSQGHHFITTASCRARDPGVDGRLSDPLADLSSPAGCCPHSFQRHQPCSRKHTAPALPRFGTPRAHLHRAPAPTAGTQPRTGSTGRGRAGHPHGPGPCSQLLGARSWSQQGSQPRGPAPHRTSHSLLGLQRWNIWDPLAGSI